MSNAVHRNPLRSLAILLVVILVVMGAALGAGVVTTPKADAQVASQDLVLVNDTDGDTDLTVEMVATQLMMVDTITVDKIGDGHFDTARDGYYFEIAGKKYDETNAELTVEPNRVQLAMSNAVELNPGDEVIMYWGRLGEGDWTYFPQASGGEQGVAAGEVDPATVVDPADDTQPENVTDLENTSSLAENTTTEDRLPAVAPMQARGMMNGAAGSLRCEPGNFYSITPQGKVYRVQAPVGGTGFTADSTTNPSIDFGAVRQGTGSYSQMNGLGIGAGGNVAYAFDRNTSGSRGWFGTRNYDAVTIYRWDPSAGAQRRTSFVPNVPGMTAGRFVGGAVDPTVSDLFYFGGMSTAWLTTQVWQVRFHLWEYNNTTDSVRYIGYAVVHDDLRADPGSGNGDLAFDSNGNMYLLYHNYYNRDHIVRVVPVTADSIAGANGGQIPTQSVTSISVDAEWNHSFTGLAFNYDGNIIVQNSVGSSDSMVRIVDPNTGATVRGPQRLTGGWPAGYDLASCNGFPTVELKKDIVDRARDTDQFELEILRASESGGEPLVVSNARTSGSATGDQAEQAGPVPAIVGKTYIVRESGATEIGGEAPPAQAEDYDTTLRCTNTSTGGDINLTRRSDYEWSFVVPDASPYDVPIISCTYVNSPNVGELKWNKVGEQEDGTTPQPLGGTTWELKRLDDLEADPIAVIDCVGDECSSHPDAIVDIDGAEGGFHLERLPLGEYELREVGAPDGYQLIDPIRFTLDAQTPGRTIDLGDIVNEFTRGSVSWSKVDENGELIAGSEWKLAGPDPSTDSIVIADNTGQSDYEGPDTDPAPGRFRVGDLRLGKYSLSETRAPDGYAIVETEPQSFEVTEASLNKDLRAMDNYPIQIEWTKIDATSDEVLPGSTWKLTKDDAETVVEDCVSGDQSACDGPDLNGEGGQFLVRDIEPGTYVLVEESAPDGYLASDIETTIVVTNSGYTLNGSAEQAFAIDGEAKTASLQLGTFPNSPAIASLEFTKVDPDGALLGGSSWSLTLQGPEGADSNPIEFSDCVAGPCTELDQDPTPGKFLLKELPLGTYLLEETAAPDGFAIPEGGLTATVELTSEHLHVPLNAGEFVNARAEGNVAWRKIAAENPNGISGEILLEGSEWEITPVDGNGGSPTGDSIAVTDCIGGDCVNTTDKDPAAGVFRVDGLEAGWYRLVETKAPNEFQLDDTPHYFQVIRHGETVELDPLTNVFIGQVNLPLTGGRGVGVQFGIAALLFAAAWLARRKLA